MSIKIKVRYREWGDKMEPVPNGPEHIAQLELPDSADIGHLCNELGVKRVARCEMRGCSIMISGPYSDQGELVDEATYRLSGSVDSEQNLLERLSDYEIMVDRRQINAKEPVQQMGLRMSLLMTRKP